MARINTAVGCTFRVAFVLKNRVLTYDRQLVFRTWLATDSGRMQYEMILFADDEQPNERDTRFTIHCSLDGVNVLPGIYNWELLLKEKNGAMYCLMPMRENLLCVYESIQALSAEEA